MIEAELRKHMPFDISGWKNLILIYSFWTDLVLLIQCHNLALKSAAKVKFNHVNTWALSILNHIFIYMLISKLDLIYLLQSCR